MKKVIILIAGLLLSASSVFSQDVWTRVSGSPQENTLNDIVRIPGTEKLIAVGEGSTVMISSDAGETWDIILHPAGKGNDYICYGVYFINENIGFIYGGWETVLKTTDGGYTWSDKYAAGNSHWYTHLNDITFADEAHGIAVGDNGLLLKTADCGETWDTLTSGVSFGLYRIAFSDSLTGYITCDSHTQLLKTEDGGNTWSVINFPQGIGNHFITDIVFLNDSAGVIVCDAFDNLFIYRTDNMGVNWNEVYSGGPSSSEGKLIFLDNYKGFYSVPTPIQYSTFLVVTNDGGLSWNSYMPGLSWKDARSICSFDANSAFTVGYYGSIHKSTNSGMDWTPLYHKIFDGDVYSVRFVDQDYGYAFSDGTDGGVSHTYLMKTEDGGMSWDKACDFNFFVGSSCFLNRDTGFVASYFMGLSFNITTDGGATWNLFQTGYSYHYPTVIKFYDMNNGFIGGGDFLVRTSDGGNTWQFCSYNSFNDIEYKSADTVFAVGYTVLRSTDGGQTWETIMIEDFIKGYDLYFLNNQTAFLTGYNQIFKSVDGGSTWSPALLNNAHPIDILSISFPTPEIGYASGRGTYENMLKTTDGGNTWNPIETNESSVLNNVCFFDADNGLAFGNNGLMIKTTTGGVVLVEKPSHDNSGNLLKVYPNPSSSYVTIESQQNSKWHLELSNLNGQILFQRSVNDKSTVIDISSLPPGLYFVRLSNDKTVEVGKFVKL